MSYSDEHKYDDIINLEHPTSPTHPRMSMKDRAAQFAPFAALTGYGDAVKDTVKQVDSVPYFDTAETEEYDYNPDWQP